MLNRFTEKTKVDSQTRPPENRQILGSAHVSPHAFTCVSLKLSYCPAPHTSKYSISATLHIVNRASSVSVDAMSHACCKYACYMASIGTALARSICVNLVLHPLHTAVPARLPVAAGQDLHPSRAVLLPGGGCQSFDHGKRRSVACGVVAHQRPISEPTAHPVSVS